MKKQSKIEALTEKPIFRIILTLASTVLSVCVLAFSSLTIYSVVESNYEKAPTFLLWIFIFLCLMRIVMFLKNRTKINFIKSVILILFNIILGIVVLFAKNNPVIFSITAGLYCATIVLARVFEIIEDHSIRNIIMNVLMILIALLLGIGLISTPTSTEENLQAVILIECIFIAFVSFIEAMTVALAQLKVKVLFRIITGTSSLEVLFGLLVMMIAFSFIFVAIEPNINEFPEALWYCFAVVTTIGFGDFVAVTPMGRILTVMLGLYGLIVVAVITSIIVNFYNETLGKRDSKELKEIQKEEKDNR